MPRTKKALDHETRKNVYDYITSNPGVSFGHIKKFFGINESTLKYHLKFLERTKKITSRKEGKLRCYFCSDAGDFQRIPSPIFEMNLLNDNQKRVLRLIRKNPGISKKELLYNTKLTGKILNYTLNRLLELELIWKVKYSDGIGYEYITKDKLKTEIVNELILKLISNEIDEKTFIQTKKALDEMDVDDI